MGFYKILRKRSAEKGLEGDLTCKGFARELATLLLLIFDTVE